jgi:carboxylate-amine ligase
MIGMRTSPAWGPSLGGHAPFRLGVEEELLLVEPGTFRPVADTDACIADIEPGPGKVLGEICEGVVELVTPVVGDAHEAIAHLAALRRSVNRGTGARLMGTGLHPTLEFMDTRHRGGERYEQISDHTRSLLRRGPYCGVHVHVGLPDAGTAIIAFNGMRRWIPVLIALGANSPFWHGRESGLAAARMVIAHSVPRSGVPRAFTDYADYEQTLAGILAEAEIDDYTQMWWDMRPHPRLGTLEIRAIDAQASLRDLAGLVALVHGLVIHEATTTRPAASPSPEVLAESLFRAYRDGRAARLGLGGPVRPVVDHAAEAIALARPHLEAIGADDALGEVERLIREGNGADRQRAAYSAAGMHGVLAMLTAESSGRLTRVHTGADADVVSIHAAR